MKIVLADKQAIFRAGIAKVLGVEDELRIVAQVQASDQIAPALEKFRPQILIFASSLSPDVHGLAQIAARFKTRLVVVAKMESRLPPLSEPEHTEWCTATWAARR